MTNLYLTQFKSDANVLSLVEIGNESRNHFEVNNEHTLLRITTLWVLMHLYSR
jgi:hypothetical protein